MSSLRFAHVCAHSHLQYARKCVLLSYSGEGEERREGREEREKGGKRGTLSLGKCVTADIC